MADLDRGVVVADFGNQLAAADRPRLTAAGTRVGGAHQGAADDDGDGQPEHAPREQPYLLAGDGIGKRHHQNRTGID